MGPAVLLLSHGSRDPRAAFVVDELVAAVHRRTGIEVRACHLDFTDPTPDVALQDLATAGHDDIRLVPLLFTPGYHLGTDVPTAVAASGVTGIADVGIAPGLVTDDPRDRALLLRALTDRLAEAGADAFDGLVLAAAGSSHEPAREVVARLARDLGELHGIPAVAAFAAATGPRVDGALEALRADGCARPAVASLFVAPGRLPDAVSARAGEAPVADPLGVTPAFVDLLVRHAGLPARV
jgi:sirohydrochlorin ferrochelatase